jgi:hypothetical protein
MGKKMEKNINKTNEWATWRWANAKIDKKSLAIFSQVYLAICQ